MGSAGSKLSQKGAQGLKNFKKAVDNLPTDGITQEELDRVLSQESFRPKTDMLLKEAREKMQAQMGENGLSKDETINYVQQKDEAFVSQLEGTFQKLANESREQPDLPFSSNCELPKDRSDTPLQIKHIPGQLTSQEMIDLFGNSSLLSTIEGQQEVAKRFDLPPETMDCLLRYVAYPKMEKRREETKELDAVWPAWKKDIDIS